MSKVEEIRKRHATKARILDLMGTPDPTHDDRGALLAALDGEWQSEIPTEGRWHLAVPPEVRGKWGDGFTWPMEVEISVGGLVIIHRLHYNVRGVGAPMFTGALWQRRTVPADPFTEGGA